MDLYTMRAPHGLTGSPHRASSVKQPTPAQLDENTGFCLSVASIEAFFNVCLLHMWLLSGFASTVCTNHGCMGSAGLFATQAAARAEGNPEAAAKSKVGQMFGSGSPLAPFVEPLTMYYQVKAMLQHL